MKMLLSIILLALATLSSTVDARYKDPVKDEDLEFFIKSVNFFGENAKDVHPGDARSEWEDLTSAFTRLSCDEQQQLMSYGVYMILKDKGLKKSKQKYGHHDIGLEVINDYIVELSQECEPAR